MGLISVAVVVRFVSILDQTNRKMRIEYSTDRRDLNVSKRH